MIYRHGDLLIKPTKSNKKGKVKDSLTLALGEFTGHSHQLKGKVALLDGVVGESGLTFKVEDVAATLSHEEHNPIEIQPGTYVVEIEREYSYFDREIEKVVD